MAEYQLILDDGRSTDLMAETVEAVDPAEAQLLAQLRFAASPDLFSTLVTRRGMEVALVRRPQ